MDISQEYRCVECPINCSMPRSNVPAGGVNPSHRHLQPLVYCIRSPRNLCNSVSIERPEARKSMREHQLSL